MSVTKLLVEPTYKRDSGLWVLNTQKFKINRNFIISEQSIVYMPPKQIGGNHKHPRQEAIIGIGKELLLLWKDENGVIQDEYMQKQDEISLFIIPSNVPHTVINQSAHESAILYEFADDVQHDVVEVNLLNEFTKRK